MRVITTACMSGLVFGLHRVGTKNVFSAVLKGLSLNFFTKIKLMPSTDARRILTAVPQSDWKRLATSSHLLAWLATIKNDLSVEDATKLALDRPLWRLLAASRAMH